MDKDESKKKIEELEKKIEKLAIEKTKLGSNAASHQEQMNMSFKRMVELDGKMEMLRELIEEEKSKSTT